MRQRVLLAIVGVMLGLGTAWAEDDNERGGRDDPPAAAEPAGSDDQAGHAGGDDGADTPAARPGDGAGDGTANADEAKQPDGGGDGISDTDEAKQPDSGGDGISDTDEAKQPDSDGDGISDADEAKQADGGGDGVSDADEAKQHDSDGDGISDADETRAAAHADEDDEEPYNKFDLDGDGKADAELEAEWKETLGGYSPTIDEDAVDAALDARGEEAELAPSMTAEDFRKVVALIKKVVLGKMEKKMAKGSAKKLATFSVGVFLFSLLGLVLLAMPLALRKKYPGKGKVLFTYSALAAGTFFVTVHLFGGVLYGMKTAQTALGSSTNPGLAIASGTFDTLYDNAEDYIVMGKELFVPTLMQLEGNSDEQPAVLLIENGMKIVEDANVFLAIAKLFKKIDFVFQVLPILLFLVTMILFALAIRPTLSEIVKLPMRAAAGEAGVGRDTTKRALRRVWGELLATACTVGVLTALTLLSAMILGQIVKPALDAMLGYFSLAVTYLQFVEGASSGIVFLTLFGVVLFLVLNLATLILSMSFFLGKSQKIFQGRFNEGVPVATHKRFFVWGIPAVLFVQLFPLVFVVGAEWALDKINASLLSGITDADAVPWTKIMLAGPLFLVGAYALAFWAARGFRAIGFLASYKVKPTKPGAPAAPAEPV